LTGVRRTTVPALGRAGSGRPKGYSSTPAPPPQRARAGREREEGLHVPALPRLSERTLGQLLSGASLSMDDVYALLDARKS